MSSHRLALVLIVALGAAALVGTHGALLKSLSARMVLPVAGVAVVAALAVALHLGVIGAVLTRLRRHSHPKDD